MKIITICGSMRFVREMMEISERIELQGNVVLMPIYNPSIIYKRRSFNTR